MAEVNTVVGRVATGALGRTLMHEHLTTAFPGGEVDTIRPDASFADRVATCVDAIQELQAEGFTSLLDPCPMDMGRDVRLMQEVASRTGFNIVCATGLYNEEFGGSSYWRLKFKLRPGSEAELTELMIRELTEGIAGGDAKAGVIKVATGHGAITDYERKVFTASAAASNATGAPILTHTDAVLGDQQVALLTSLGVPAHKILVGHCCGSNDTHYHRAIVDTGAYIGFDRFGLTSVNTDQNRIDNLVRLIKAGGVNQTIVSHDCVWCLPGHIFSQAEWAAIIRNRSGSLHFSRNIAPKLREAGVSQAEIDTMLVDNPRRYFSGEAPPAAPAGGH